MIWASELGLGSFVVSVWDGGTTDLFGEDSETVAYVLTAGRNAERRGVARRVADRRDAMFIGICWSFLDECYTRCEESKDEGQGLDIEIGSGELVVEMKSRSVGGVPDAEVQ